MDHIEKTARVLTYNFICISGLVVKSIVAIDGPRVRFTADASGLSDVTHFE